MAVHANFTVAREHAQQRPSARRAPMSIASKQLDNSRRRLNTPLHPITHTPCAVQPTNAMAAASADAAAAAAAASAAKPLGAGAITPAARYDPDDHKVVATWATKAGLAQMLKGKL